MKRKLIRLEIILLSIIASLIIISNNVESSERYNNNTNAKILWHKSGDYRYRAPIIINNYLIQGSNSSLTCFDKASGREIWKYSDKSVDFLKYDFFASKNNRLLILSSDLDMKIFAFDVNNGKSAWNIKLDSLIKSTFFTQSHDKIFAATGKALYIINSLSGKILEKLYFSDAVIEDMAGNENEVFIGFKNGKVKRINMRNKKIENYVQVKQGYFSGCFLKNKTLYVLRKNKIMAVSDGKILWDKNIGSKGHFKFYNKYFKCDSTGANSDGSKYFVDLLILNAETGKEVLSGNFTNIDCDTLDENSAVFLAEQNKYGYFDIESKKYIWKNELSQNVKMTTSVYDKESKTIFVMIWYKDNSKTHDIYAVNALNGKILWKYSVDYDLEYGLANNKTLYLWTGNDIMAITGKN